MSSYSVKASFDSCDAFMCIKNSLYNNYTFLYGRFYRIKFESAAFIITNLYVKHPPPKHSSRKSIFISSYLKKSRFVAVDFSDVLSVRREAQLLHRRP